LKSACHSRSSCGKLLDPIDLIEPYSAVSGSKDVEVRDTNHLYLKQSVLSDDLRKWVNAAEGWPPLATSIALKWLDGAAENGADWESWWRTDKGANDVQYVQFMGKDNVAFHTLSFPTTIIGSGEPWKLVDQLKAFNWVTWYGGKFSTSEKRGVFMDQALDIAPSDYWRWHLIANAPEGSDAAFTWEEFQGSVNSDLANVLGNFVNRITKYCVGKFDGKVPEGGEYAKRWQRPARFGRREMNTSPRPRRGHTIKRISTKRLWACV